MQIAKENVVSIHYSVSTTTGDTIDSSFDGEPLTFIMGSKYMIEGIEDALYGHEKGDVFEVTVAPDKAYGERLEQLVQNVPLSMFGDIEVEVGMSFRATTDNGEQSVIVIDKKEDEIVVDGNHPLAGIELVFNVSIEDVRQASAEELVQGLKPQTQSCCSSSGCSSNKH